MLFDFAGTLLMPRPPREQLAAAGCHDEALARAYERAGMPGGPYPVSVPPELAAAYAERDTGPAAHERAYTALMRSAGEPWPGFAAAVYAQIREPAGWVPYADAREVVEALPVPAGVVSNVGFDIRPILRGHGLGRLAERCVQSYEVGAAKPDPAIFRAALDLLGAGAEETLMVGDHPDADGGAAAAGLAVLILPMTPPGSVHGLDAVLRRL